MSEQRSSTTMLDVSELGEHGHGLERPESVLCLRRGDIFVSHRAAGVTHIDPDGTQRVIGRRAEVEGHELVPNGIALMPDRTLLLANIGEAGGVWRLGMDGSLSPFLMEVDGERLAAANFVMQDGEGRVWITVSTRKQPRFLAYDARVADGFVVLADRKGARIVADGCCFTNELRLSTDGRAAFVSETFGRRISRFQVRPDGSLGARETFCEFGRGTFPDGIELDEEEHLWLTSVVSNRLYRIAPDGRAALVLEDAQDEHVEYVETALAEGRMRREHFYAMKSRRLMNIASVAFGGPDRRTGYLGSLLGKSLATFRSPVAGRRPVHWEYDV